MTQEEANELYEKIKLIFDMKWWCFTSNEERLEILEMVKGKINVCVHKG